MAPKESISGSKRKVQETEEKKKKQKKNEKDEDEVKAPKKKKKKTENARFDAKVVAFLERAFPDRKSMFDRVIRCFRKHFLLDAESVRELDIDKLAAIGLPIGIQIRFLSALKKHGKLLV